MDNSTNFDALGDKTVLVWINPDTITGEDYIWRANLMAVLEERIDFVSLLLRKKRYAAQTGNIYLPFHQIGKVG